MIRTLPGRRDPIDLEVDVAESGIVVASWVERVENMDPDPSWAYVAWSTSSGVWRRPKLLVDRTLSYPQTSSAVSANGRMAVAYHRRGGLVYRERSRGGTWTPELRIVPRSTDNPLLMISASGDAVVVAWSPDRGSFTYREDPQVAVASDGHALVAVWNHADVESVETFAHAPGGDWRTARLPRPPPATLDGYEVAVGSTGRFAATWQRRGLRLSTLTLK